MNRISNLRTTVPRSVGLPVLTAISLATLVSAREATDTTEENYIDVPPVARPASPNPLLLFVGQMRPATADEAQVEDALALLSSATRTDAIASLKERLRRLVEIRAHEGSPQVCEWIQQDLLIALECEPDVFIEGNRRSFALFDDEEGGIMLVKDSPDRAHRVELLVPASWESDWILALDNEEEVFAEKNIVAGLRAAADWLSRVSTR